MFALMAVLAVSITSAAKFGPKHYDISENSAYAEFDEELTGTCILYAQYHSDEERLDLSPEVGCDVSIGGEVVAAAIAGILIISSAAKAALGIHM